MESLRPIDLSLQLLPSLLLVTVDKIKSKLNDEELHECSLKCVENPLVDCVNFVSSMRRDLSLDELPKLQVTKMTQLPW